MNDNSSKIVLCVAWFSIAVSVLMCVDLNFSGPYVPICGVIRKKAVMNKNKLGIKYTIYIEDDLRKESIFVSENTYHEIKAQDNVIIAISKYFSIPRGVKYYNNAGIICSDYTESMSICKTLLFFMIFPFILLMPNVAKTKMYYYPFIILSVLVIIYWLLRIADSIYIYNYLIK